ncbi:MAG: cryptochrome/photolyase family protein [Rhodothermales bacterium]|nr:cryptochrome/photolyase family protein [Rhodothermales bacterium]MBO6780669.1 cryptochrome/photolyase family protein [Rhodothermales bacterium]
MPFDAPRVSGPVERLFVVLGDQLDYQSELIHGLSEHDAVLMMEVREESEHVVTHHQRTVVFLSAMRHFCQHLQREDIRVEYVALDDDDNTHSFGSELERAIDRLDPASVEVVRPGSWRVLDMLSDAADDLSVHEDPHFLSTPQDFEDWASGRKALTMEYWYREMRKQHGILVSGDGKPEGGDWNYDKENRNAFKQAPKPPAPWTADADEITTEVHELVGEMLELEGAAELPRWPVTRQQALYQLDSFIKGSLPDFGQWQDAMWTGDALLWHSHLSPALNLKLLTPREVVDRAVDAYHRGDAPLNSVEGFVRQIIGWREFMRGIYWTQRKDYRDHNRLRARRELPEAYWTADSSMRCVQEAVRPVLTMGYSHHIQRLMITGNLALTAGVHPGAVRDWYLGMFVDGVDWVTTPNVVGMALYADGGVVATKPYAAGGGYVNRMSNYCSECRFNPRKRTGPDACPLTTLYWDFLARNRDDFEDNHRMGLMLKNLDRMEAPELEKVRDRAGEVQRAL